MIRKDNYEGSLDPNFEYVKKHNFRSGKFIQSVPVFLDDKTIQRLLKAKKYPLYGIEIKQPQPTLPNVNYGTRQQGFEPTISYDYHSTGLNFMVAKSYDENGKSRLDLMATYTLNLQSGMSIGLYYIPNGDLSEICFLARACHHNGTNDHRNLDGTVIDKNSLHIHEISEDYINTMIERFGENEEILLSKLQSANASVVEGNQECSVENLIRAIKKEYNITDEPIAIDNTQLKNLYSQIELQINKHEEIDDETF